MDSKTITTNRRREKRGEVEPEDLSANLVVQLGVVTNQTWYERNTGRNIKDIIITGGGKRVEITINGNTPYQHFLLTAERKFWCCIQSGESPRPFGVEPPQPRIQAVRMVDMSESNSRAEVAGLFRSTRSAFLEHERANVVLKGLMPEDAKEAADHWVRAKRSKSGAISFDLIDGGKSHAAGQ